MAEASTELTREISDGSEPKRAEMEDTELNGERDLKVRKDWQLRLGVLQK